MLRSGRSELTGGPIVRDDMSVHPSLTKDDGEKRALQIYIWSTGLHIGGVTISTYTIENVVASASLGSELDLQLLAMSLDKAEYEPEKFPGLIYRTKEPKTALLLFKSGKVVCTGAKNSEQVHQAIGMVSELIREAGIAVADSPEIVVQNIVASADLGEELNLNAIAITFGLEQVEYEPEQFPGLVYRMTDPKVVILIFGSGRLVCTGGKTPHDIEVAVAKITEELRSNGLLR